MSFFERSLSNPVQNSVSLFKLNHMLSEIVLAVDPRSIFTYEISPSSNALKLGCLISYHKNNCLLPSVCTSACSGEKSLNILSSRNVFAEVEWDVSFNSLHDTWREKLSVDSQFNYSLDSISRHRSSIRYI